MDGVIFLNTTFNNRSWANTQRKDEFSPQMPYSVNAFSSRNIIIASIAIFISLCSAVLIVMTRLKNPIKIILLNLLTGDITVMVAILLMIVFGPQNHFLCITTIYFLALGVVQCHGAIAIISMNNFLAIFYPYRYRSMLTTRNAAIGVVLVWILLSFCPLGLVTVKVSATIPICTPLAIGTRFGTVVIALILLILDLSIITMNSLLCMKLRQREHSSFLRVAPLTPRTLTLNDTNTLTTPVNGSNENDNVDSNRRTTLMVLQGHDNNVTINSSQMRPMTDYNYINNLQEVPTHPRPSPNGTPHIGVTSTLSPSNNINVINTTNIATRATTRTTITTTATTTNITNVNSSRSASSIRFRKLSYAMIIIALWCSILNIPFISFMFYIAIGAEDRFQANYGHFGLVATTSLSIDILGDPVIYAWRFINWKVISRRLWSVCQHRR